MDYGEVAAYLEATRGMASVLIPSACHSNWLDNANAECSILCRPLYYSRHLIHDARKNQRTADDPQKARYPGLRVQILMGMKIDARRHRNSFTKAVPFKRRR